MTWLEGYQQVEDRLREFWSDHPNGRMLTECVIEDACDPGDVILFMASAWRDGGPRGVIEVPPGTPPDVMRAVSEAWSLAHETGASEVIMRGATHRAISSPPDATGYAHQRILEHPPARRNGDPDVTAPEWTSPWEVAETSAIGRALANLGYAPKGKRPSREEVSKAMVAASSEGGGSTEPTAYGEGVNGSEGEPPSDPTFDDLVARFRGSRAKAVRHLNRTNGTEYTARTILDVTPPELVAAMGAEDIE